MIPDADLIWEQISLHKVAIAKNDIDDAISPGYFLYTQLIEPFIQTDTKRLFLSPHSFIYGIPFSAIPTSLSKVQSSAEPSGTTTSRGIIAGDISSFNVEATNWLGAKFEISLINPIRRYWERVEKDIDTGLKSDSLFNTLVNWIAKSLADEYDYPYIFFGIGLVPKRG